MATKFVQPGDSIEFIAPGGGVTVDVPKQIGQVLVFPMVTAAATVRFNGMIRGVFEVTKVGSQAWTEGAIVYWDAGNTRFTTVGTGNLRAGFAVLGLAAAMPGSGAGETTGYVMLTGSAEEAGT
jgi:predicted RecA/RadA family phage recombinase